MLVILDVSPTSSPSKAVRTEQPATWVGRGYAIGNVGALLTIVGPLLAFGRFDAAATDVGIVEGIDINRHTPGVLRQGLRAGNGAEVEARRVIGSHGTLVVTVEVVNELHALYAIVGQPQLTEDVHKVGSYGFVAHHLSRFAFALFVAIGQAEVAELAARYRATALVAFSLHSGKDGVGDRLAHEAGVRALPVGRNHPKQASKEQQPAPLHFAFLT